MRRPPRPRSRPRPRRPALLLLAVVSAAALAVACGRSSPPPSPEVVAAIDGDPVYYDEFEGHVQRALGEPGSSLGSDVLSQLFDQFLEERLLVRLAADRGLLPEDGAPGRVARRRAVELLLADASPEWTEGTHQDPAAVAAWYEAHEERFHRPPRVRLRQILFEDRTGAEAALAEIRAGAPFPDVARRLAADPRVTAGGVGVDELAREDVPPAFAEVIFALDAGEVSEVVEAEYGFHLFQVVEHLPAEVLPLEAVREDVERAMREAAADRALGSLVEEARERYDVSVWDRNLPFNYRGIHLAESG